MEVRRPGIHFQEQKFPKSYITVITAILEGANHHAFLVFGSRTDFIKSSESYIHDVLSLQN